ncbi:MAG: YkgJ family cysteine cluster protein [Pseudomonadota bacterium]|nr:MAG: YkgJ family cysteine cluster protein [Pseudomonadota bacterium]
MNAARKIPVRKRFDCSQCPGYCCSYQIPVNERDLARLAKHFGVSQKEAAERYTKTFEGEPVLRHRKDHIYKSVCMFFDRDERRCTVYPVRPSICRRYPGVNRCGYYDFLKFERGLHGDEDFIPDA